MSHTGSPCFPISFLNLWLILALWYHFYTSRCLSDIALVSSVHFLWLLPKPFYDTFFSAFAQVFYFSKKVTQVQIRCNFKEHVPTAFDANPHLSVPVSITSFCGKYEEATADGSARLASFRSNEVWRRLKPNVNRFPVAWWWVKQLPCLLLRWRTDGTYIHESLREQT